MQSIGNRFNRQKIGVIVTDEDYPKIIVILIAIVKFLRRLHISDIIYKKLYYLNSKVIKF